MPGVRIRPQADRTVPDDGLVVLRDLGRPFPPPKDGQRLEDVQAVCSKCGVQHFHKSLHLQLRAGSVIVSESVWAKMQKAPDSFGFEYVNHVSDPPAQGMTPGQETKLFEKFVTEILPLPAGKGSK